MVESFLVVDEPIITLLVAHSLGRTLGGESVIGSRICANKNQRERGDNSMVDERNQPQTIHSIYKLDACMPLLEG